MTKLSFCWTFYSCDFTNLNGKGKKKEVHHLSFLYKSSHSMDHKCILSLSIVSTISLLLSIIFSPLSFLSSASCFSFLLPSFLFSSFVRSKQCSFSNNLIYSLSPPLSSPTLFWIPLITVNYSLGPSILSTIYITRISSTKILSHHFKLISRI